MPPDTRRQTAKIWLRYALSDLAIARAPLPQGAILESLCFHAQQAAEKSLKAVLIYYGIEFPRTHNIQALVELLPSTAHDDLNVIPTLRLTAYAVETRYPSIVEPVTQQEHAEMLQAAKAVVYWARKTTGLDEESTESQPI